jgi:hypothetical protein
MFLNIQNAAGGNIGLHVIHMQLIIFLIIHYMQPDDDWIQ